MREWETEKSASRTHMNTLITWLINIVSIVLCMSAETHGTICNIKEQSLYLDRISVCPTSLDLRIYWHDAPHRFWGRGRKKPAMLRMRLPYMNPCWPWWFSVSKKTLKSWGVNQLYASPTWSWQTKAYTVTTSTIQTNTYCDISHC